LITARTGGDRLQPGRTGRPQWRRVQAMSRSGSSIPASSSISPEPAWRASSPTKERRHYLRDQPYRTPPGERASRGHPPGCPGCLATGLAHAHCV